jgi:RNA polymerase sigma-70 factor, ECF subfamily
MPLPDELTLIETRRTLRHVSTRADKAASEARYWSEQMLAVAQQRDRECFMHIYDHFAPRLKRYLLGLGVGASLAEELVQEALIRLWRKAAQFDPRRANLSTWLFRIARNLYIDSVRREPNWRPIDDAVDQLHAETAPMRGTQAESYAEQANLRSAINALPAMQARLVRMSYFEAKSHSEIAAELDMALGTVKSSLRRAFGKLRASLEQPR